MDDSETKHEPINYHHKSSSVKRNFKTQVLARKFMATVLGDIDSFIHKKFFESDTTNKSNILQNSETMTQQNLEI